MTTTPYILTWKPTKSPKTWTLRHLGYTAVITLTADGSQWVVYRQGIKGAIYRGWSSLVSDFTGAQRGLVAAIAHDTTPQAKRPALLTFVPYGRRKYVEAYLRGKGYADVRLPRRQGEVFVLGEAGSPVVDEVVRHLGLIAPGTVVV